ncbi:MAG: histidine kinase [Acidimicrobiales bacterium]|jgi:signal transduction histidine kinase|nr:histidine kinase [Acidimicrobiales bacterium]
MADSTLDDEVFLRGLVGLVEAQAAQLDSLRGALSTLEGRVALRAEVDRLLAHELRSPLAVVIGGLQTLLDDELDPAMRHELAVRALAQATQLGDMLDDMLAPADVESGPLFARTRVRSVSLVQLLDQAANAVPHLRTLGRLAVETDRHVQISTAPSRFVAIVVNLLENAAKYGAGGRVTLRARVEDTGVVVEVLDEGPGLDGVPPEVLFQAFSRGRHPGEAPGHGIGLYMVRMLARSLGGDVTIDDRPEGGTVVQVTLPQRRDEDAAVAARQRSKDICR